MGKTKTDGRSRDAGIQVITGIQGRGVIIIWTVCAGSKNNAWGRKVGVLNMRYTVNILIVLLLTIVIIRILMNVLNHFGIDFVGIAEELLKKIKGSNK